MYKIALVLFLIIISSTGYSQSNLNQIIYLDERDNQIHQLTYSTRLLKTIYREHTINRDSITIKKLRKLYEFDSLNATELSQIQNILSKYLDLKDFNKNIVIIYRDSLLGYNEFVSSIDQRKAHDAMDIDNEQKYLNRRKNYDSNQKKCKKIADKNNTIAVYGYSGSENFVYEPKYYINKKLPSVLRSVFFQKKKRGTLILKPNGQYFFFSYLTHKQIIKMLNSDWAKYIKQYNSVLKNGNVYTMKFIVDMNSEHKEDMRALARKQISQRNRGSQNIGDIKPNKRYRLKTPYNCFGYASY